MTTSRNQTAVAAFILLMIFGCAGQQQKINTEFLMCQLGQRGVASGQHEVGFCGSGLNDELVAFACSWDTKTRAKAYGTAPEFNFAVRNSSCTFTNENQSRAQCHFEYIATPWADYRAKRAPEGPWRESNVDLTYFVNKTYGDDGHFGEQFYWVADFSCRDKTK